MKQHVAYGYVYVSPLGDEDGCPVKVWPDSFCEDFKNAAGWLTDDKEKAMSVLGYTARPELVKCRAEFFIGEDE